MKDKTMLLLIKTGGAILVAGIMLFLISITLFEMNQCTLTPLFAAVFLPAIAIVAVLVIMIKKQSRGIRNGLPMHDELSTRIKHSAGYYSYLITVYFLLAVMWYHFLMDEMPLPQILPEHLAMTTMLFMLVVFGLSYLIIQRRGLK